MNHQVIDPTELSQAGRATTVAPENTETTGDLELQEVEQDMEKKGYGQGQDQDQETTTQDDSQGPMAYNEEDDQWFRMDDVNQIQKERDANKVVAKPSYSMNFIWMEKVLGLAVDQEFSRGARAPVTEYFFWGESRDDGNDAWGDLAKALESKTFIDKADKVELMNVATEVIEYWQSGDNSKVPVELVVDKYPQAYFLKG